MKIEAGKYYRARGGQVFGPMVWEAADHPNYPWGLVSSELENSWAENGRWSMSGREHPFDLVAEVYVSDMPPCEGVNLPAIDGPNGPFRVVEETKTLRDEFAMRLMDRDAFAVGYKDEAEQLYRAADAMMEARKK